jgi:hypothetical protein
MKPENCKVGMKIERFWDSHNNVKKGSIYTAAAVNIECESVRLEETNDNYWYDLNLFRPIEITNKFEIGDEAVWNGKVEIWGKRYDEEMKEYEYAVVDKNNGRTLLFESELSPLKKKDELEVGDKFIDIYENKVNILAVHKKHKNGIRYFGTYNNNKYCDIWPVDEIKEIIYE